MSTSQATVSMLSTRSAQPDASVSAATTWSPSPTYWHFPDSSWPSVQDMSPGPDLDLSADAVPRNLPEDSKLQGADFATVFETFQDPFSLSSILLNFDVVLDTDIRQIALIQACQATESKGVIDALVVGGLHETADRIRYLSTLHEDDSEECPISLDSLLHFAWFVLRHKELPEPEVGLDFEGLLQAEWESPDESATVMIFGVNGMVRFAAVSLDSNPDRRVEGSLPVDSVIETLGTFMPHLEDA